MKQTVSLHGMVFRRALGLYPEEQLLPNRFEADVDLTGPVGGPFVDYALVYTIAKAVFDRALPTLEELTTALVENLQVHFPQVAHMRICIRKYHPPLGGEVGYAQLCLET